jgi:hypothetical protein
LTIDNLAKKRAPVDDNLRSFSQGTLGLCRIFILKKQRNSPCILLLVVKIKFNASWCEIIHQRIMGRETTKELLMGFTQIVNGPQSTGCILII